MKTTTLGRSGLQVSRIAFGTWQLGGDWGRFDEDAAVAAIRRARELGVNLFDTAQAYGFGASERLLGRALRDELTAHRDQLVIATKGGLRMTEAGTGPRREPRWLRQGVDASLTRAGHRAHRPVPGALARPEGSGRRDGGRPGRAGRRGQDRPRRGVQLRRGADGRVRRDAAGGDLQPPYHLFRRDIEADMLPYTRAHDIGVLVYGPLAHGLLTGTMSENTTFAVDDWRSTSAMFTGEGYRRNLAAVRALEKLAADRASPSVSWPSPGRWRTPRCTSRSSEPGERRTSRTASPPPTSHWTAADLAEIDTIMAAASPVAGPSPESV